jgi:hypothetical protein
LAPTEQVGRCTVAFLSSGGVAEQRQRQARLRRAAYRDWGNHYMVRHHHASSTTKHKNQKLSVVLHQNHVARCRLDTDIRCSLAPDGVGRSAHIRPGCAGPTSNGAAAACAPWLRTAPPPWYPPPPIDHPFLVLLDPPFRYQQSRFPAVCTTGR